MPSGSGSPRDPGDAPTDLSVAEEQGVGRCGIQKSPPVLIPGAIKDKGNIAFALKISFCATLCYIPVPRQSIGRALQPPVTTVMVAGLSDYRRDEVYEHSIPPVGVQMVGGLVLGIGSACVSISLHGFDYFARHPDCRYRLHRGLDRWWIEVQLRRPSACVCLLLW